MTRRFTVLLPALACLLAAAPAQAAGTPAAPGQPNLEQNIAQPLRYRPQGADFVIVNGAEFFNRPLYGGNTAFRVDGGDRPEFSLYLPGRGGNVRLGLRSAKGTLWLHAARSITMRYRPGELHYEIADDLLGPDGRVEVIAVAYAATEGLGLEVRGKGLPPGAQLVFAFGPGNGERGRRDGDIGTERVPISRYFQFSPAFVRETRIELLGHRFRAIGTHATITAAISAPARLHRADATLWNDAAALLDAGAGSNANVVAGTVPLAKQPVYLAFQVTARAKTVFYRNHHHRVHCLALQMGGVSENGK